MQQIIISKAKVASIKNVLVAPVSAATFQGATKSGASSWAFYLGIGWYIGAPGSLAMSVAESYINTNRSAQVSSHATFFTNLNSNMTAGNFTEVKLNVPDPVTLNSGQSYFSDGLPVVAAYRDSAGNWISQS
ncbi:MAG: hypothetical protein BGO41_01295 [Clostridiales bacterium 38-18]|nr:MAG: hypothetical protein BGO41_01295 [Clostridiales bacterium 38-18]